MRKKLIIGKLVEKSNTLGVFKMRPDLDDIKYKLDNDHSSNWTYFRNTENEYTTKNDCLYYLNGVYPIVEVYNEGLLLNTTFGVLLTDTGELLTFMYPVLEADSPFSFEQINSHIAYFFKPLQVGGFYTLMELLDNRKEILGDDVVKTIQDAVYQAFKNGTLPTGQAKNSQ